MNWEIYEKISKFQEEGWDSKNATGMNTKYPVPDSCCVEDAEYCGLEYDFDNEVNEVRPVGEDKGCSKSVIHLGYIMPKHHE